MMRFRLDQLIRNTIPTLGLLGLIIGGFQEAHAQIDWRADTVWTQMYLKGENAHKEGKYSQAAGWLEQAIKRAEGFGQFDERLIESLKLLQQIYLDGRREEEADEIGRRLAAIAAARPETAVDRHTRQTARIRELHAQSSERLDAADYNGAAVRIREALAIADSVRAFNRVIRADLTAMLAVAQRELGDPTAAEQLFLVTLAYRLNGDERGPDSAIIAVINDLAGLYRAESDKDNTLRFDKVARIIASRTDWRDSRDVQESLWEALHQAGEAALSEGRLAEAQELLMAARTQATLIDPADERVGRSLDALGRVQWQLEMLEVAEHLFRQSVAIMEEARGRKDPLVAPPLIHLGQLGQSTQRLPVADTAFTDAIKILKRKKVRGDTTLGTLQYDLARICNELGDQRRAAKLYREAIKTDEKLLGKEHPNVARDAYGLAMHHLRQLEYEKAERYFLQAITTAELSLGPDDPTLAVYLTGYAENLRAQSRNAEAEQILKRVENMPGGVDAGSP